ncbi:AAA family ATPase [Cytobacillus sp. Hm23]
MFFLQMSGFPGSGKSSLAKVIAKRTGAIVVDHDIVKTALIESLESAIDPKVAGKISYNIDWSLVEYYLSQQNSVILDSPCLYTEMIEKGQRLCTKYGTNYKYVECYLNDLTEINRRLKQRKRMQSQIREATEENFRLTINSSKKPSDSYGLIVDSSKPLHSYVNEVIEYINSKD